MAKKFLLDPTGVRELLQKRYRQQCRHWLQPGEESQIKWPQSIPLGIPTQQQAHARISEVRKWQDEWQAWNGPGQVQWVQRHWQHLGKQQLPERLNIDSPESVAEIIGQRQQWDCARKRYGEMIHHWPALAAVLPGNFEVLASWGEEDFLQLVKVVDWLSVHRNQGIYVRQLPIPGIDSKWLETRQKLITEWLSHILGLSWCGDLYELTGLRRLPLTIRFRILDPAIRKIVGGLEDLQCPLEEVARMELPVTTVFIVENLQSGLAFADLPGCLVFIGQGYAVDHLGRIPWLRNVNCRYWGDIDSDGFDILNRLRHYLPHAQSLLMDRDTLLSHRDYWSSELRTSNTDPDALTSEEKSFLNEMRQGKYGIRVRLEQERIGWDYAWPRIKAAVKP